MCLGFIEEIVKSVRETAQVIWQVFQYFRPTLITQKFNSQLSAAIVNVQLSSMKQLNTR